MVGSSTKRMIVIYFTSLNIQVITESAVYDWNDSSMVTAISGALSLCRGISISMIFEVIELFLVLSNEPCNDFSCELSRMSSFI